MCFWEGTKLQGMCIFFPFSTRTLWITNVFLLSSFLVSVWPLFPPSLPVPSLSSRFISRIHSLSRVPPPPPVVQGWVREGGGRGGGSGLVVGWWGRCLGIERRGAWPLVCLGAPNESVIHGKRGSHRDRIRGALSNRSPERVKRYLICPPRRQLPLGSVCVFVGVSVCVCVGVSVNVSEGCWLGAGVPTPHPLTQPKNKIQSCSKTDQLYSCYFFNHAQEMKFNNPLTFCCTICIVSSGCSSLFVVLFHSLSTSMELVYSK